ncbi:MAG: threonine transporter [Methylibium sp. NZG]|nr:MAG: threonine transporter [Methylibium sp. NZG]
MSEALAPTPLLAAFLVASVVLAITPGPGVIYIVTRTLAQGRRAGIASVLGVALGNLGNALGASVGLAALFAVSSMAFTVVKFAGAAYLVWLGVQALRPVAFAAAPARSEGPSSVVGANAGRLLRDGFVVALLNPKTAIFFAAFLPQFIAPGAAPLLQSVGLGVAFVLIAACTDTAYVLAAGMVAPRLGGLRASAKVGRWLTAAVFFGLGMLTATSEPHRPK